MTKRPASGVDGDGAPDRGQHTTSFSSLDPRKRSRLRQPLPKADIAWRSKLLKEKEALVQQAKLRKRYSRMRDRALARHAAASTGGRGDLVVESQSKHGEDASSEDESSDEENKNAASAEDHNGDSAIHPDRQAMLDDEDEKDDHTRDELDEPAASGAPRNRWQDRNDKRNLPKLNKYHREMAEADKKKAEAEAREAEFRRRAAEREAKRAERERMQKRMAKARRVNVRQGGITRGNQGGHDSRGRRLGRESGVLLDKVRKMVGK